MKHKLYPALLGSVGFILDNYPEPDNSRQERLLLISNYLRENSSDRNLMFVCTHNSRRSHLAQYWSAVAAVYYNVKNVKVYSGGTEATAFHPNTIAALEDSCFEIIEPDKQSDNPEYSVKIGGTLPGIPGFSKKIDHPINPSERFCAVMVCSDADENCPFVPGVTKRVSLPFDDPKVSDGTPEQALTYKRRSHEIAREILWAFSQV